MLGHGESRRNLGNAAFVDPALGVANLVEGEPSHQAGRHGEEHGGSNAQIELGGDTVAELKQLGQFVHHGFLLGKVSMGT